jgi:MlaD protein
MPLQDLTPQLRTRLNRVEKAVGWFVFLATALLLFGFGYYIYHTAEHKGWFKIKAPFRTFVKTSQGLNPGDPVYMMGFAVGTITGLEPQKPYETNNVELRFEITEPYFRYLWTGGSIAKVNAADFLGKRQLEITRATNGYELVVTQPVSVHPLDEAKSLMQSAPGQWQLAQDIFAGKTNLLFHAYDHLEAVFDATNAAVLATATFESNSVYIFDNQAQDRHRVVASWDGRVHHYKIFRPGDDIAWMRAVETPQVALPGILALTNKISAVLDHTADVTSNLNATIVAVQPAVTNFVAISSQLREPGGLTAWALGASSQFQLQTALTNVNALLANTDANLNDLAGSIGVTLENVAGITSNLNVQVQANSNLLGGLAKTVGDADDFVQGLKRHWLLRSAFKSQPTNAPARK